MRRAAANSNTAFSGTLTGGSSSILSKAGSGTLTINSNVNAVAGDFAGTLNLTGGGLAFNVSNAFTGTVNVSAGTTLKLSDATLSIANLNFIGAGTITLDFSGTTSTLSATNLDIASGVTINIINWSLATDFFFATNWIGATADLFNNGNIAPMNQAVFTGYTASQTGWDSYDDRIRPNVPEPTTYGALLLAAMGALLGLRRFRQTRPTAKPALPGSGAR